MDKKDSFQPGDSSIWVFFKDQCRVVLEMIFRERNEKDASTFEVKAVASDGKVPYEPGDRVIVSKDKFKFS
jgi:hypothetical protein